MKDKDESYWKEKLSEEQYKVLREKGTELPFSGELLHNEEKGTYSCAACGTSLFSSDTKFDSGSGWPSFFDVISKGNVDLSSDDSIGMARTEVTCATCGGHLGHIFPDGPEDKGGQRYCINSVALDFKEE